MPLLLGFFFAPNLGLGKVTVRFSPSGLGLLSPSVDPRTGWGSGDNPRGDLGKRATDVDEEKLISSLSLPTAGNRGHVTNTPGAPRVRTVDLI